MEYLGARSSRKNWTTPGSAKCCPLDVMLSGTSVNRTVSDLDKIGKTIEVPQDLNLVQNWQRVAFFYQRMKVTLYHVHLKSYVHDFGFNMKCILQSNYVSSFIEIIWNMIEPSHGRLEDGLPKQSWHHLMVISFSLVTSWAYLWAKACFNASSWCHIQTRCINV